MFLNHPYGHTLLFQNKNQKALFCFGPPTTRRSRPREVGDLPQGSKPLVDWCFSGKRSKKRSSALQVTINPFFREAGTSSGTGPRKPIGITIFFFSRKRTKKSVVLLRRSYIIIPKLRQSRPRDLEVFCKNIIALMN